MRLSGGGLEVGRRWAAHAGVLWARSKPSRENEKGQRWATARELAQEAFAVFRILFSSPTLIQNLN
jgi:hypothetical protein